MGAFLVLSLKNFNKQHKKFTSLYSYNSKDLQHWAKEQVYISLGNILLGLAALEINATPIEGIEPYIVDADLI